MKGQNFCCTSHFEVLLNAFNRLMSGTLLSSVGDQAWRQRTIQNEFLNFYIIHTTFHDQVVLQLEGSRF
jgi:hypothetical protein